MKGLMTIKQFCSVYPWPSESAMRAYVFRAEECGLGKAFIRVKRRVLIDPEVFFEAIKTQSEEKDRSVGKK